MGRTNVELDDTLTSKAFRLTGARTKKDLVGMALEALVRQESRKKMLSLEGKIRWEGSLPRMRKARLDPR